ncbi:hypothetical protein Q31b_56840 [Novipirellula aureliae]|uniref:PEP-CTERM protein-sorting domain-containing protein n=1 Tax=Novipirellula aureliae TaxID=2527966 RepID=A0A5C6DCY1_9BACT|nr:PEP-CTERM sorting domain-containing protein [Novipirellula aureliae]TWU33627.1 hypothetical protein Q31b_56840 [Novipirellula aureliae]
MKCLCFDAARACFKLSLALAVSLLSVQQATAEVYVYGHQLGNESDATISRYTKTDSTTGSWDVDYGVVTAAESDTQFAADILGNIFTMDGATIKRLVPGIGGSPASFSTISTVGTIPTVTNLRNLEVTNSGDFLLSDSGSSTIHRYSHSISNWQSVVIDDPVPDGLQEVDATGDYDPFSNRYILGLNTATVAVEVDLNDFTNVGSQVFSLNELTSPVGDERLGSIVDGKFVRHTGNTGRLDRWNLSPSFAPTSSTSLIDLPGTDVDAMAGGVDRNAQELYVFYQDDNQFGTVDVNTGAYQPLSGLPGPTPANLGLSSITVVDTDVKLNNIQGVVSRYNTTISSLEIGGSNGTGDLQVAFNTLDSTGTVTVGALDSGTLAIDAFATFKSGDTFTNSAIGTTMIDAMGTLDATGQNVNNSGFMRIDGELIGTLNNETGGRVSGIGEMDELNIKFGSTLAPGNSVGEIEATVVAWQGGGAFEFEINDFAPGGEGGTWDLLTADELVFTESGAGDYLISVSSLSGAIPGEALNFDLNADYSLMFAQANLLTGFDAALFDIDASGFQNATAVDAAWSVSSQDSKLFLNYRISAVPEPTSLGLFSVLGLAWSTRRRRRR